MTKILHAPVEVAGQVALQVAALRALGEDARAWVRPHVFGFEPKPDRVLRSGGWRARLDAAVVAPHALAFDVVHFHGGGSFLPSKTGYLDARLMRRRGAKVVQQFSGSDARLPDVEIARNRWYVNSYGEDVRVTRRRLARWADIGEGHVIFQDHSFDEFFAPYFPHVHIVPLAVNIEKLVPQPLTGDLAGKGPRRLVVAHAPSNLAFKGTDVVRAAVKRLQDGGVPFDYVEVHGASHQEAIERMRVADIVIDQVRAGAYGTVTAEAMALGKPVICYILPSLAPTYGKDFPVVSADPNSLEEVLRELMRSSADRIRLGAASRRYAEAVHDHRKIGTRLLEVYGRLP